MTVESQKITVHQRGERTKLISSRLISLRGSDFIKRWSPRRNQWDNGPHFTDEQRLKRARVFCQTSNQNRKQKVPKQNLRKNRKQTVFSVLVVLHWHFQLNLIKPQRKTSPLCVCRGSGSWSHQDTSNALATRVMGRSWVIIAQGCQLSLRVVNHGVMREQVCGTSVSDAGVAGSIASRLVTAKLPGRDGLLKHRMKMTWA